MAPQIIEALINGLVYAMPKLWEAAAAVIVALVSYLTDPNNLAMLIESTIAIMFALLTGMIQNIATFVTFVPQLFKAVVTAFANTDWASIGKNLIAGIKDGVLNAIPGLLSTLKDGAKKAFESVKDFFKIKSPSGLFRDEVGKYIPQGIAVGVENEMPETADRIKKSIKDNTDVDDMVNGFNMVSRMRANNSQPIHLTVPVYIGNEELKTYTYKAVDSVMKQRGLRDLKTTGGYNT
jgi:hypothetical protein